MSGSSFIKIACVLSLTLLLGACVRRPPTVSPESMEQKAPLTHIVKYQGETLGVISKWYTGSSENWRAILKANPKLDVYRMKLGQNIIIPETLIKRRDKFPQTYLKDFYKEADAASRGSQETGKASGKSVSKPVEQSVLGLPPEKALPEVSKIVPPVTTPAAAVSESEVVPLFDEKPAQATGEAAGAAAGQLVPAQPGLDPAAQVPESPRAKTREELLRELLQE
jgi:hypothetical protein